jgi:hypothetical protein
MPKARSRRVMWGLACVDAAVVTWMMIVLALITVMVIYRRDTRWPTAVIPLWNAEHKRLRIDGWSVGIYSLHAFSLAEYSSAAGQTLFHRGGGLTRQSFLGFIF